MYNRKEAEKMLIDTYGFKSTGEKHNENLFTKWYQAFYLFNKFHIDKRKPHYSSLINAGQMTREEALLELRKPPEYIPIMSHEDEKKVLAYKKRRHEDFKQDKLWNFLVIIIRALRKPFRKLIKSGKSIKELS